MPNKLVFFMASFLSLTSTFILITSEASSGAKDDGNIQFNPGVDHGCCQVIIRDLKNITQVLVAEVLHMRTLNAQFNPAAVESSSSNLTTSFPNLTLNNKYYLEGYESETMQYLENSPILPDLGSYPATEYGDNKNKTILSALDYWEAFLARLRKRDE